MCDYREKYKNLYMRLFNKLNFISKENNDVSEYLEILDKINKSVCSWLQCNLDYNGIMTVYNKGITLLNNLDKQIENKYEYSIRHKNVSYLIDLSSYIIKCLGNINSNLDSFSKDFINDIYRIAYQVIKLEFYYYNSSSVWNYCKENEGHLLHISRDIIKDAKKYNYNILNRDKIVNDDFIKTISKKESKVLEANLFRLLDELKRKLDDIIKEISRNKSKIVSNKKDIASVKSKIEQKKKYRTKCILKAISSWLLTIMVLGGAIYGGAKTKKYRNYVAKYSSIDDSITELDNVYKSDIDSLHTYMIVYGDANIKDDKYYRDAYVFNLSSIKSDNIEDYMGIDLSCYNYQINSIVEDNPVCINEYVEIYKQMVDKNDYNHDFSVNDMFLYMIILIILSLNLEKLCVLLYSRSKFGIISPWINLYNDLRVNGNNGESFEDKYKKLSSDNYELKNDVNELLKDKDFILSLYNDIVNNKEFNHKFGVDNKIKRIK